ncbi:MAG: hypothetical protein HY738_04665 [Bacteroidia bacterium]|nr:hypothetical protein [Bacteroidia bacterium]
MNKAILLSHGSGGKLMLDLIKNLFINYFDNKIISTQTDSAVLDKYNKNIVFTCVQGILNILSQK